MNIVIQFLFNTLVSPFHGSSLNMCVLYVVMNNLFE